MRYLTDRGYSARRTAGSRGPFDIIAYKETAFGAKQFFIQVKATNEDTILIDHDEIVDLIRDAKKAGVEYAYAIRFGGERWRVFRRPLMRTMRKKKGQDAVVDVGMGKRLEEVFT